MKSKKIVAGLLAVLTLSVASPAMSNLGLPSFMDMGITVSAAEEHVFTGEIKKIISVGILVTPAADSPEAAQASQFMVKYADTEAFNVGDTVTVTYSDEVSVEKDVGTVTATKVEVGSNATAAPVDTETKPGPEVDTTTTETKTEDKPTVTETNVDDTASKPASTTPDTGEGSAMLGVGAVTIAAALLSKKFSVK